MPSGRIIVHLCPLLTNNPHIVHARAPRPSRTWGEPPRAAPVAETIALSIDSGHVRAVRSDLVRTFEVIVAQASNDDGQQIVFSNVPVEADRHTQQLRGLLHRLGATPCTEGSVRARRSEKGRLSTT